MYAINLTASTWPLLSLKGVMHEFSGSVRLTDSVLMLSARTCDELLEEADGGEAGAAPLHGDLAAIMAVAMAFSGERLLGSGLASRSGLLPAPAPMPMAMPRLCE